MGQKREEKAIKAIERDRAPTLREREGRELRLSPIDWPVSAFRDPRECASAVDLQEAAFVVDDFSGSAFRFLSSAEATVLGPTALQELSVAEDDPCLYLSSRPLYCTSMRGLAGCS